MNRAARKASGAALAAALLSAAGCAGGGGGYRAEIDTPLADVTVERAAENGDAREAAGDASAAAQPPIQPPAPIAVSNTNTVGQDNAIVINGDVTLTLPAGATLESVLRSPGAEPDAVDANSGEADGDGPAGSAVETGPPGRSPAAAEPAPEPAPDLYLQNVAGREGFSAHRYCDGQYTAIGHGHLVVDPATGRRLLCEDWTEAQADAEWATPAWLWEELDRVRRDVLAEIALMTGRTGLTNFADMYVALYLRQFEDAAAEIRDSALGCPAGLPYEACLARPNARRDYLAGLMADGAGAK